jgi:hypothetical protein
MEVPMTRSTSWRELDAASAPPAPRRPPVETADEHAAQGGSMHRDVTHREDGEAAVGDGPVDGWTDTDEFLSMEF